MAHLNSMKVGIIPKTIVNSKIAVLEHFVPFFTIFTLDPLTSAVCVSSGQVHIGQPPVVDAKDPLPLGRGHRPSLISVFLRPIIKF